MDEVKDAIEEFMLMLMLMLAEVIILDDNEDDTGGLEIVLAYALVERSVDENVGEGGSIFDTSTGHTSASTPPIVRAVQLLKGADGKPAKALPPHE
jgi:hypothetical protein